MKPFVQRDIGSILDAVIKESIKSKLSQGALREKENQQKTSNDSIFNTGEDKGSSSNNGDDKETPEPSKTHVDDIDALKNVPSIKDIITKLNELRSGKSLKDEAVSKAFSEYFESLTDAEKTALFAFVKGISQIVTGEIPGSEVLDPADSPSNIEMTKSDQKDVKHLKPNVIKAPSPPESEKKSGPRKEDTTPPVPISAKKSM